ncbi:Polyamine aminopropyltransferase [Nocardioides aquaticus]|uniref:Polyamine aminopropyltransferase n=1 Tax=Nocardioides aquaticus TaxID=160826 RepID=A0ABX8ECA8_9ACTN|nr:spermidine synthase [Nocardioides aquaticus]QVT77869.1 Polyamine aminopropyltransferase [Nocardioides aquaticus]
MAGRGGGSRFEELDHAETPWGVVSLRRRHDLVTDREVFEVKLDDDFLMTSQFTATEEELARIALRALTGDALRVLVGGLGLGYTAATALADPRVAHVTVVEAVERVVEWHRRDLFPDTRGLAADPRTTLLHDDFFALVRSRAHDGEYDAVLVDIDHAPDRLLRPDHGDFYSPGGLAAVAALLDPAGVLALWSDEPPDDAVLAAMGTAFAGATSHVVTFDNAATGGTSSCTVYLATGPTRPR